MLEMTKKPHFPWQDMSGAGLGESGMGVGREEGGSAVCLCVLSA